MVIKKIKAFIKWTFLLAAVFCLSFLIAGGANFYLSDNEMFVKVQNTTGVLSTKIGEGIDNIDSKDIKSHLDKLSQTETDKDSSLDEVEALMAEDDDSRSEKAGNGQSPYPLFLRPLQAHKGERHEDPQPPAARPSEMGRFQGI